MKAFANEAWERSPRAHSEGGRISCHRRLLLGSFQALSPSVCSELSPWSFGSGLEWYEENWPQINSMNSFYMPPAGDLSALSSVYAQLQKAVGAPRRYFLDGRGAGIGRWRRCYRRGEGMSLRRSTSFSRPDVPVIQGLSFELPKGNPLSGKGQGNLRLCRCAFTKAKADRSPLPIQWNFLIYRHGASLGPRAAGCVALSTSENITYGKISARKRRLFRS